MKSQLRSYWIVALVMLTVVSANSQSKTIEGLAKLRAQNTGVIMDGKSVKGYFIFYSLGRAKKGNRTFILNILDENLNEVKATTLVEDKRTVLLSGMYNGEFICLKMYDSYQQSKSFLFFDKSGNQVHRQDVPASGVDRTVLYPVTGEGFIDYSINQYGGGFAMQYIPNPIGNETDIITPWVFSYVSEWNLESNVSMLCMTDNVVVNLLAISRSNSRKLRFSIQGIDIKTGIELFNTELTDTYNMQPLNAYVDENNKINILGMYYPPDVDIAKENATGLFNHQMNEKGEIIEEKYLRWTYELRDFINIDNDGKVMTENQSGFLYFHDIVKHTDGSIIAIAEQYRKTIDAASIALNIFAGVAASATGGFVTSTSGLTKLVIGDLLLFRFNPDFSIQSVDFMSKTTSDFNLPAGYGFTNVHLLSELIKNSGGFDYRYTTQDAEEEVTTIGYVDHEKQTGVEKEWVFNAVSLYDGELIKDRLPLGKPKELYNRTILPAKVGNILILDYSKTENTIEMHLERINY